jgi:hypothetical protein
LSIGRLDCLPNNQGDSNQGEQFFLKMRKKTFGVRLERKASPRQRQRKRRGDRALRPADEILFCRASKQRTSNEEDKKEHLRRGGFCRYASLRATLRSPRFFANIIQEQVQV